MFFVLIDLEGKVHNISQPPYPTAAPPAMDSRISEWLETESWGYLCNRMQSSNLHPRMEFFLSDRLQGRYRAHISRMQNELFNLWLIKQSNSEVPYQQEPLDRHQLELLNENTATLKAIFNMASEAIITINTTGQIVSVNPAVNSMFGYELEELIGQNIKMLMPSPYREEHDSFLERYQITKTSRVIGLTRALKAKHKNGQEFPIELSISEVFVNGRVYFTGVIRDVTQRWEAEQALRKRERLQAAMAVLGRRGLEGKDIFSFLNLASEVVADALGADCVGIWEFNRKENRMELAAGLGWHNGVVGVAQVDCQVPCLVNQALKHGHARSDNLSSDNRFETIEVLQQHQLVSGVAQSVMGTERKYGVLDVYYRKGHTISPYHVDFLMVASNIITMAIDRKRIELSILRKVEETTRELKNSLEKEKELGRLKSRIVSTVSHEFRTPLMTIQAASDLIKLYGDRMTHEEMQEELHKIQYRVQHMENLLEDMLNYNMVENDQVQFHPTQVTLSTVVDSLMRDLEQSPFKTSRIKIIQPAGDPSCRLDPNLLQLVLRNLLTNALKYSHDSKQVVFQIEAMPRQFVFTIIDQGIGIPAAEQRSLFDPFFRASNVGTVQGTGMGLSIVQNAVKIQGGQLSLISPVDQETHTGTKITVTIPCH